jgi:hypothetical protein
VPAHHRPVQVHPAEEHEQRRVAGAGAEPALQEGPGLPQPAVAEERLGPGAERVGVAGQQGQRQAERRTYPTSASTASASSLR